MRKLIYALLLAAAGCANIPVDNLQEAQRYQIGKESIFSMGKKSCTLNVLFNKKYPRISQKTKEKDIETILKTTEYALKRHTEDLTSEEKQFKEYFNMLKRITKSNPDIEFDIISNTGTNYLLLRLGNWDAIYYSPAIIIKQKSLNPFTLAHEFCHATDKHYSKINYALSKAHRCRMEAVAISGEQHIADYFSIVYETNELADKLWNKASLSIDDLRFLYQRRKTFEEVFHNESRNIVAKLMTHILLDKFKGDLEKTYFFLRKNDCETVYKQIYSHIRNKNYYTSALHAVSDQQARLDLRAFVYIKNKHSKINLK